MIPSATSETQQLAPFERRGYPVGQGTPQDDLVLAEIWRMLRKRRFLIAGWVLACTLLAGLYVVVKSPRYEATARIEVSPAGTNSMGLDELASRVLGPSDPTIQLQ